MQESDCNTEKAERGYWELVGERSDLQRILYLEAWGQEKGIPVCHFRAFIGHYRNKGS